MPHGSHAPQEPPVFALLSLVVCLAAQPVVCETVTPDYTLSRYRPAADVALSEQIGLSLARAFRSLGLCEIRSAASTARPR
jgi:hypothetical protein